jgi:hypothetical protein
MTRKRSAPAAGARREDPAGALVAPHEAVEGEPGTVRRVADAAVIGRVPTEAAGVRAWMVLAPVERLGARGQLDPRQVQAARELYRDWAIGPCGARDPDRPGGQGGMGSGPAAPAWARVPVSQVRLEATRRHARALAALVPAERRLVGLVVCEERTLEAVADLLGIKVTTKQLVRWLRGSLDKLAVHYRL